MNIGRAHRKADAFTLVELLCAIAIISILTALILSAVNQAKSRAQYIGCVGHLQQMGVAFQLFMHDHGDKFPMAVPLAEGGSQEFVQNGYAIGGEFYFSWHHFQTLSNELGLPKMLICPTDTRLPAADFGGLQNSNLSYFVGVSAGFAKPDSLLAGDRNLTADWFPNPSILHLAATNRLRWTGELHRFKGNLLFADGRVEEWNDARLAANVDESPAGADLFMPTAMSDVPAPAAPVSGYGNYSGSRPVIETPPSPPQPVARSKHLGNNFPGGGSPVDASTARSAEEPGRPAGAGTNPVNSSAMNSPAPGAASTGLAAGGNLPPETELSATPTFDERVVKTVRRIIFGTYLLVLLFFLVLLAFKARQRAQRNRERRERAG